MRMEKCSRAYWQRPSSVQIMKIEKHYQRSKPYEPESAVRVKTEKNNNWNNMKFRSIFWQSSLLFIVFGGFEKQMKGHHFHLNENQFAKKNY